MDAEESPSAQTELAIRLTPLEKRLLLIAVCSSTEQE